MTWQGQIDKSVLHPGLVAVTERAHIKLAERGTPFKVYSGLRTFKEQDELYAKGRTTGKKGAIVTKAKGGQSLHNYGLAVDQAPIKGNGVWWPHKKKEFRFWTPLETALTEAAAEIDDEQDDGIDYEWGGRWRGIVDCPHFQVRTTLTELISGHYPHCRDLEWLVKAHTGFLFDSDWMFRRVQHLLNMQSYPCGVVDGWFGKRTVKSLLSFQSDYKIETKPPGGTWALNKQTVEKLVRLHQTSTSSPLEGLCHQW